MNRGQFTFAFEKLYAVCAKPHGNFFTVYHNSNLLKVGFKCSKGGLGTFPPTLSRHTSVVRALASVDHSFSAVVAN